MGATGCFVAIWRMEIGELAVDHAVADGRKVGGGPKALSVSTSTDTPKSWSLRVGGPVGKGWGLQPEREQGPLWSLVEDADTD